VIHSLHSDFGLRVIIVSSIANGAGSVAVKALQAFHTTFSTSYRLDIILFVSISRSLALLSLTLGTVIGIYIILPSSSGGINSEPILVNNHNHRIKSTQLIARTVFLFFKANISIGSYTFCKNLTIGISRSCFNFHFNKKTHKTGAKNKLLNNAQIIANIFVNASGENSFPSCHCKANIGRKESIIISIANIKGQATSFVDFIITSTLLSKEIVFSLPEAIFFSSSLSSLLYAFSVTTIAASTIVHIAIAIHQRDIIFDGIVNSFIHKNVISIHITKDITVTSDAPKFHKNKNIITTVIKSSEVNIDFRVSID
jgi:hypothetical protein